MHRINASSPLFDLSEPELRKVHAEVLVAFSGVDETIAGSRRIDWAAFDCIHNLNA